MSGQTVLYMLDADDRPRGPFVGAPGLDFQALTAEFRAQRYAQAESKREDFCLVSNDDFIDWLIDRNILSPLEATHVEIDIDMTGENAYAPSHWPLCPACGEGRGEQNWDMGTLRRALNRVATYRECQGCGHRFDSHDEPIESDQPMLPDDGRYTPSGCVPYTLSQVSGLPFDQVLAACRARGWDEQNGMLALHAIALARDFGLSVHRGYMDASNLTLRRFLDRASPRKRYIVATKGHWLAVVHGSNRDMADTGMRAKVYEFWEVEGDACLANSHCRELESCS